MEKIDRELLIKEISTRLPYEVKAKVWGWDEEKRKVEVSLRIYSINVDGYVYFEANDYNVNYLNVDNCLLYLRPMSSITEEEKDEVEVFIFNKWYQENSCKIDKEGWIEILANYDVSGIDPCFCSDYVDWLNAHHFDYCNLIERGLAIDCTSLNIY